MVGVGNPTLIEASVRKTIKIAYERDKKKLIDPSSGKGGPRGVNMLLGPL